MLNQHNPNKPYVFQEYPKWVTPTGGKPVLCADAAEEEQILGKKEATPSKPVEVEAPVNRLAEVTEPTPQAAALTPPPEEEHKEEPAPKSKKKRSRNRE